MNVIALDFSVLEDKDSFFKESCRYWTFCSGFLVKVISLKWVIPEIYEEVTVKVKACIDAIPLGFTTDCWMFQAVYLLVY